jgi:hypothetical protein
VDRLSLITTAKFRIICNPKSTVPKSIRKLPINESAMRIGLKMKTVTISGILILAATLSIGASPMAASVAEPADSKRMARAKDLIADEQWARAIQELRAALNDAKEPNKDEALFWLAHSQNQTMDFAPAVETIRRLEREYPSSRWVHPARSLLIELAQKLQRSDFLWWTARPRVAVTPRPEPKPAEAPPARAGGGRRTIRPAKPVESATPTPAAGAAAPVSETPQPPAAWVIETYRPDTDMRIQALGSLIHTDAQKVIPMLREIALEADNPNAARRAVFVLAQSRKPEAQSTVVEVAKVGPEQVRIAAVRELGLWGGPDVSKALLQVYSAANERVKLAVVKSLGERSERTALLNIARSEHVRSLRESAIVALGRAGGREQLRTLYSSLPSEFKRPVIIGLFNAKADEELIRIATTEKNTRLRNEALSRLRLLGTEKARTYLESVRR